MLQNRAIKLSFRAILLSTAMLLTIGEGLFAQAQPEDPFADPADPKPEKPSPEDSVPTPPAKPPRGIPPPALTPNPKMPHRMGAAMMIAGFGITAAALSVDQIAPVDIKTALGIAAALQTIAPAGLLALHRKNPDLYSRIPIVGQWKPGWPTHNKLVPLLYGGAIGCALLLRVLTRSV